MGKKVFVRLTNEDQLDAFVKEFQRIGLLETKKDLLENPGKSLKEIMLIKDEWDQFVSDCASIGENPDDEAKKLEEMARNVSED